MNSLFIGLYFDRGDATQGTRLVQPRTRGWTSGIRIQAGERDFLLPTAPRPTLGSTQPPIQWVQGTLSTKVKRPGRKPDNSHPIPRSRMMQLYLHNFTFGLDTTHAFGRCSVWTSDWAPFIFTDISRGFSQPLQVNAGIEVPWCGSVVLNLVEMATPFSFDQIFSLLICIYIN
jgi:hypothetical protein